jgi:hypothetical protein
MSEEKNHVVIKNGQRVTGLVSEQEAEKQAAEMRQRINEKAGQPVKESTVQVKQNICG